ncbi:hypothetical protein [uncultured Serinicoccus sp.]|uniref:hypothetical protein n=1 Tax=uncultured Serinicoccus sp. TaxID=735514 RepID=UPI00262438C8|nr:hypothetical protein [uncultured Serinicoccus sp.]
MSPDLPAARPDGVARRAAVVVFYGGLALLVVLCASRLLTEIVPAPLAGRIAYNSEAYLFAVVLAGWIQFVLPRLDATRRLPAAVVVGALWGLIGVGLVLSDLPSSVRTLNETALALALLIPYVSLRRPASPWWLVSVPAIVVLVAGAVAWAPDSWVIDQAETLGFLVLGVLTFDVVDKGLLQPEVTVSAARRWGWCGVLLLEPVVVSGLGTGMREGGGASAATLEFLGRVHESFFGVLLVVLVLALFPRKGPADTAERRVTSTQPVGVSSTRE